MRYVRNCQTIEKLLEFVQCDDIIGASIAEFIINALNNAGLNPLMYRAQTCDGVGNMAGMEKGAAAKFRSKTGNKKAVYFHCISHKLNLFLSRASKILQVMNRVSTMQMLDIFFKYSPKRQRKLEQSITEIATESLKKKVKPLCETRWVEKHTVFTDLSQLCKSIVLCLKAILLNNDLSSFFPLRIC